MVDAVLNSLVAGMVGTVAFVVIKQIVDAQDTSGWSGAERAIIDVIPIALGIMVLVGMFVGLSRLRST